MSEPEPEPFITPIPVPARNDSADPADAAPPTGIRVIDRRRISEPDTAPDPLTVPRKVKNFFHPPKHVRGLIVPISSEATFVEAAGFSTPCKKGWARAAARKWRSFSGASGMFLSGYGAITHVLTFDRTADKIRETGYAPETRPDPEISMHGDAGRLLDFHVIILPVRKTEEDPIDLEILARSMRRLVHLLDSIPALQIYTAPGSFWLPIIRDKMTPWEKTQTYTVPYIAGCVGRVYDAAGIASPAGPRIEIVEEAGVG